ncbi:HAD hydrolase family protein, partial [Streptococcus pyogenes]
WVPEDQVAQVVTAFNQAFHGELVAVTSGYGSIDLMPAGIHKAWGLRRIMEPMGIAPNQVMAFGDNDNDVEMLELAQYSYAV